MRTNAIHSLHPVAKLADGRLIVGDRRIDTHGEFLSVEIALTGMRVPHRTGDPLCTSGLVSTNGHSDQSTRSRDVMFGASLSHNFMITAKKPVS